MRLQLITCINAHSNISCFLLFSFININKFYVHVIYELLLFIPAPLTLLLDVNMATLAKLATSNVQTIAIEVIVPPMTMEI